MNATRIRYDRPIWIRSEEHGGAVTDVKQRFHTPIPRLIAGVFGLLVVALTLSVFLSISTVPTDLSTYLLPAVARESDLGFLYADLLDIKPPLIFAIFVPWIAIFGHSLIGLWIFYALFLIVLFSAFYLALAQELRAWFASLIFVFALIAVFRFTMLEEFLFTTEAIGSTAILLGLVLVRWKSQSLAVLFSAAFLFGAAGQVKDVFLLVPLALLPIMWSHPQRIRAFAIAAAGVVSAIVGTVALLLWWGPGVFPAYLEILQIKRQRFPLPDAVEIGPRFIDHASQFGQWLPFLGFFALSCVAAIFLSLHSQAMNLPELRKVVTPTNSEWMVLTYLATIYLGFLWQGSDLLKTYALGMVFPSYLALAVLTRMVLAIVRPTSLSIRAFVITLLILGLAPAPQTLLTTAGRSVALSTLQLTEHLNRAESAPVLRPYQAIQALAGPDDCLHVAYDWTATIYYLYTDLPSCTRIVLPPLAAQMPSLGAELKEAIILRPPNIIVADPAKALINQMPFPYEGILEECYVQAPGEPTVFLIREDLPSASACVELQLMNPAISP